MFREIVIGMARNSKNSRSDHKVRTYLRNDNGKFYVVNRQLDRFNDEVKSAFQVEEITKDEAHEMVFASSNRFHSSLRARFWGYLNNWFQETQVAKITRAQVNQMDEEMVVALRKLLGASEAVPEPEPTLNPLEELESLHTPATGLVRGSMTVRHERKLSPMEQLDALISSL